MYLVALQPLPYLQGYTSHGSLEAELPGPRVSLSYAPLFLPWLRVLCVSLLSPPWDFELGHSHAWFIFADIKKQPLNKQIN